MEETSRSLLNDASDNILPVPLEPFTGLCHGTHFAPPMSLQRALCASHA
jgi:hypothetical protein